MIKVLIGTIILIGYLFTSSAVSQPASYNQLNDNKKKTGLWIENDGLTTVYYQDGLKNGIYINYNRNNRNVHAFGNYVNDLPSGIWYYFNDDGFLLFTEESIERNTCYKRIRDDGVEIMPRFTSLIKDYHLNGKLKGQGRVLYDEDIEIDYFKIGTWRYYDESGELKEKIDH